MAANERKCRKCKGRKQIAVSAGPSGYRYPVCPSCKGTGVAS